MLFSNLDDLTEDVYDRLMNRSRLEPDITGVMEDVKRIVDDVKTRGDDAVLHYTREFDGAALTDVRVKKSEFIRAVEQADPAVVNAIEMAYKNIFENKKKQVSQIGNGWTVQREGVSLGQVVRPVGSAGCYVPGGRAAYPSTVLMTAVPAKVAGVGRVICTTPPGSDGRANELVLVACRVAGVDEVYKIGGAQAIAAMAYGTKNLPKVEKIVGPGNVYVTAAKRLVMDSVGVDCPAGPSEVLIIADSTADPGFIAMDMIAQAEHDPMASSILVTTSKEIGARVIKEIESERMERREAREAIEQNAAVIVVESIDRAVEFSNKYAPEHLQIVTRSPGTVLRMIKNAGSVFLGSFTPVACGDYASGTNHVLPTGGFARVCSGLSVLDFLKFISVQEFDRNALKGLSKIIITLAEAEGLYAHAESVRRRVE